MKANVRFMSSEGLRIEKDLAVSSYCAGRTQAVSRYILCQPLKHMTHTSDHPCQVTSEEEALNLLFEGESHRVIANHQLNRTSTRGHAIFTVYVQVCGWLGVLGCSRLGVYAGVWLGVWLAGCVGCVIGWACIR